MSAPQPAAAEEVETDDEPEESGDPFDGDEEAEDEIDLDLAEVDVGDEVDESGPVEERLDELDAENADVPGRDDDDPFDGSEDSEWAEEGTWDGAGGAETDNAFGEAAGSFDGGAIADSINEGAARLAVVGLPDQFEHNGDTKYKDDLEDEFLEVFETFKLGDYGEKAADEYLDVDGDIDPLWGFTASMLVCSVLVIQMRPDGGALVGEAENAISNMTKQLTG